MGPWARYTYKVKRSSHGDDTKVRSRFN
uniref:Uncharacterized protein n=1 Tax=Anguilla anguilla TaxID=7936 RepID=A0A0E9V768_ANGAN